MERRREDKEWERQYIEHSHPELAHDPAPGHESQPEWEGFMDAEDYLNDEEKFNVTDRFSDTLKMHTLVSFVIFLGYS